MGAVWFIGRAELRRRWRAVLVVTLLVGIVGAVVVAALAGAHRTSTAFGRFQDETRAADLTVFVPTLDDATLAGLRALPGVTAIGAARQLTGVVAGHRTSIGGPLDGAIGRTVDLPRVIEGRRPRPGRAREIAVPEPLARDAGIGIGDTVEFRGFTPDQVQEVINGADVVDVGDPAGPDVPLRVVGVTRKPGDLSLEGLTGGLLLTTPAFVRTYGAEIGSFSGLVLRVRTTDAAAAQHFVEVARRRTAALGQPGEFQVQPNAEFGGAIRDATDAAANGILVFAVVAAVAGLVVVAVVLRRFVDGGGLMLPALRGLGLSRRGRVLALALPVAPVAVGGTILAVAGAWLLSPVFPLGLARDAEPHLGFAFDGRVLGLGWLVVAVVVAGLGLAAAWSVVRAARRAEAPERLRPSRVTSAAVAAGCTPAITVGLGMALDPGRDRSSVPVRPALAGAVVAVLGIVAVTVMASSLDGLPGTPRAYGYNWDAHVVVEEPDWVDPTAVCGPVRTALVDDPAVADAATACSAGVEVAGYSVTAVGFTPISSGSIGPTVLAGRAPSAPDEIALGTKTASAIGARIGDRVRVAGPGGAGRYRVVGRVVLPTFSTPDGDQGDLQAVADGAAFTGAGLASLADRGPAPARIVVRWQPGADVDAAAARFADLPGGVSRPLGATVPLEVDRFGQLHVLPWLLGGFLALIGMLAVGYGVVSAVGRRRRDIAVLKTLGFRRRQVYETIGTQASVFGIVGLVLGIPVGVIVGRTAWDVVSGRTGLASYPAVPVLAVIAFAVVTLLLVNLVAVLPARRAARVLPAVVLRSE